MMDDQFNTMRDLAINDRQVDAINGAQQLTHAIANDIGKGLRNVFSSPEPPPPPKSSGNPALGLLALGVLGGLYVYDKFFGNDEKPQQNK